MRPRTALTIAARAWSNHSKIHEPEVRGRFESLVEAWVDQRLGATPPAPVVCAACNRVLDPVFRHDTDRQFADALRVSFSGGYGMFIDAIDGDDPHAVICHGCAHALCDSQPLIAALLQVGTLHMSCGENTSGNDGFSDPAGDDVPS